MHGDALRVAQKHAPHLVAQINDSYSRGGGSVGQSGPEIVQSGKISEGQRDYSKAIDRYLEITDAHFPKNPEKLEEIWNDAFNLAMNYAKDRLNEVVDVVGNRLLAIGRYESAAEIFESVLMYDKAIEAHMQSNSNQRWDRALECAQQVRPHEMQQIYIQKIQEAKKSAYVGSGKISKIA
jgi:tetratricopeptide (TPR) repeat protein